MKLPKIGQLVKCKFCDESFSYSNDLPSQPNCQKHFSHQPQTILKDNDIKGQNKLRFDESIALLIEQKLRFDTKFLSDTYETMDYSLLGNLYIACLSLSLLIFGSSCCDSDNWKG
jgi:hypothetical protein